MRNLMILSALCFGLAANVAGQDFEFPGVTGADDPALAQAMPALAARVLTAYHEGDYEVHLDNLFRIQMVAGQYDEAARSMATLRQLRVDKIPGGGGWVNVQYELLARASALQNRAKLSLEDAYRQEFTKTLAQLDGPTSFLVKRSIRMVDPGSLETSLSQDLQNHKQKGSLTLREALKLIGDYQMRQAYRAFLPLALPLVEEDDARRYIVNKDFQFRTPDGGTVCAVIVRPRTTKRLPALMEFTIYVDSKWNLDGAMQAAAHEYVGVTGLTRGKGCSPDTPVPYIHDGADAAALIDWISAQAWSDARVGMVGGSYSGFTPWAAAKHMPKALKAIVVGAPVRTGTDVPMEGNVFWNFVYPWPFYTTDLKGPDDATYYDYKRWNRLNHEWYTSGRAYRELDKIDGTPNPIFDEWISHPSYDSYWQNLAPTPNELQRINIPILLTAGYYAGGPGAAVPYFTEHYRHNPKAQDYLLIGPYDHGTAQHGLVSLTGNVQASMAGLPIDPEAQLNIEDVRFQFFDYVLKNAPRPALLKDKVNYEVTGANTWKHAPTLTAMANQKLRFYLSSAASGEAHSLSPQPAAESFIPLKVDLADRTDADRQAPGGGFQDKAIDTWNGMEFITDPMPAGTEMSGLFSGHLEFITNKKDFDFEFDLYELTPTGEYVQLAPYWARASYVRDRTHRQLLTPGVRQQLDFRSIRLMSRQLQPGSRVVLVLSVIKEPGRQINYGTGKDVSDETIKDAGVPLEIKWYGTSYIDLPVRR